MRQVALIFLALLLTLTGCNSGAERSALPLPTVAVQPTAGTDLESAGQVARLYLDAWMAGDVDEMHSLLTFRNRELTPKDEFLALYRNAHYKLTLEALEYTPRNLTGEGRILKFQYDMTFHTRVLGSFTDAKTAAAPGD